MVGVTTKGMLPAKQREFEEKLEKLVETIALIVESYAKYYAPHDEGLLETSIKAEKIGKLQWRVFTNLEYGLYQELGFTHWKSGVWIQNAFLRPAMQRTRIEINSNAQGIWAGYPMGGTTE